MNYQTKTSFFIHILTHQIRHYVNKEVLNVLLNQENELSRKICLKIACDNKDERYLKQLQYFFIKWYTISRKENLKNGAILTDIAHKYLHIIESRDKELYDLLNNVLWQINEQGFAPLERQLLAIDYILRIFEEKHQKDRAKSGKILIKREYKEGRIVNDGVFRTNKRH